MLTKLGHPHSVLNPCSARQFTLKAQIGISLMAILKCSSFLALKAGLFRMHSRIFSHTFIPISSHMNRQMVRSLSGEKSWVTAGGRVRSILPLVPSSSTRKISAWSATICGFLPYFLRAIAYSSLETICLLRMRSSLLSQVLASCVLRTISKSFGGQVALSCGQPQANAMQLAQTWYLISLMTVRVVSREMDLAVEAGRLARQLAIKQVAARPPPINRYFWMSQAFLFDMLMRQVSKIIVRIYFKYQGIKAHYQQTSAIISKAILGSALPGWQRSSAFLNLKDNIWRMFGQQLYQSSALSQLYSRHLDHQRVLRHSPLCSSERGLLICTIHMLLGMPSAIYPRNGHLFSAADQPIELQHLASGSLKSCLREFAQIGNQLQYVKQEGRRVYAFPNALLKAFVESAFQIVNKVEIAMTNKLQILQQQGGKLERSQQQYQSSTHTPITLLSLLQYTKTFAPILSFIVSAFSRLALRDNPSTPDLQTSVLFLLNLYHEECSREYCVGSLGQLLHVLFRGLLGGYLGIVREWFEMDESALAMKTHLGFFIQLDQILTLEQERIFDVKRITRREAVPELFRNTYERVIELGKTIQFIKLYFGPEQREEYRLFMNIKQQFAELDDFLDKLSACKQKQYSFFTGKERKYQTISSKLASMVRPSVTFKSIQGDNPFKMYPSMTGILSLRSNYQFPEKPQGKEKALLASSGIKKENDFAGLDINRQIDTIFSTILDRITEKCLTILQQQRIRSSIERTLKGIKKIMLFQQGDFLQEFLELTRELLEKPSEKISRNNMERLIEEAVRASGAKQLPEAIRENISFSFLKNSQGVKGWRIFSLMYRPEKPTHCIFTARVMADYGFLSNMLFNLRRCEEVLTEAWSGMVEGMGGVLKARNAVHHYVKALEGFLFAELEALWGELLEAIRQTGNVLTILELNERTLQRIKALTFQNQPLCNCLLSLVKIVDRFENIQKNLEEGVVDKLRSDVDQIWSWFMAMLDQSRSIAHFCDTFDFRGEYSL